jgi:hypothetical protein
MNSDVVFDLLVEKCCCTGKFIQFLLHFYSFAALS